MSDTYNTLLHEMGPPEFTEALQDAYAKAHVDGHPAAAEEAALKHVRAAGWYKTSEGWRQLTPDLRDKVNIRKGTPQPDGHYLIEDVDVFYPNQVKGDDEASNYTPERIHEIMKNTNKSIHGGSQPPALIREHPTAGRKDAGIATPALGHGFSFKPSPRGNGWARCNILASPEVFSEWKQGKWIGLSAGFACDKAGTNMRFGHIALLGADMQALSKLPKVEVYAAEQLFFASGLIDSRQESLHGLQGHLRPLQEKVMPAANETMTAEQKSAFSAMSTAHIALSTAFAAVAAGDANAADKEAKARIAFATAEQKMKDCGYAAGEGSSAGDGSPLEDEDDNTRVPDETELDALLAEEPPAETDVSAMHGGGSGGAATGAQYSASNAEQFEAMSGELSQLRQQVAADNKVIAALVGKQMSDDFKQFMAKKQAEGHMFDAKSSLQLFNAVAANPEAVKHVKATIENSPKDPKLTGATFSAEDAALHVRPASSPGQAGGAATGKAAVDEVQDILRKRMPGITFSAEDIQLGFIATQK